MSVFNTNQVHQLYVATAYNASVTDASNTGTLGAFKCVDGVLYFKYKGADNTLKSDYIQLKNVNYAKAFTAASMRVPYKSVTVTLAAAGMDSNSKPLVGQDYVLRINFKQFYGMSDEDTYFKSAQVHVDSTIDTAEKFYTAMRNALNAAFSKELGATATSNPYLTITSSSSGITITEKPQGWTLGKESQERVMFEVYPTEVSNAGSDVIWGTVTDATVAKGSVVVGTDGYGNGKKIADLEWFCMGERGDQYRMMGYPNNIDTTYLVDATKEYNVIELHYGFTDDGVNSYRSEKDLTIVVPLGTSGSEYDVANAIINALNTAVGDNNFIATLS